MLLFPVVLQAQDWDSLIRSMNYIPDLIGRNTPWEQVLDSAQLNYPENTVKIKEITNTCNILKGQNAGRTYPPEVLPFFYHSRGSSEYYTARETIIRKGNHYLSQLIPLLRTDAATRILTERNDPDVQGTYLTISAGKRQ